MQQERYLRVMMVDDSATLRALLHRTLVGIDRTLELTEFPSGDEALAYEGTETFNMVFLDINMPGKDGIETLEVLKQRDPNCFVVMVTANKTNEWVIKAKKAGANGYVGKPFSPDKIEKVLDDCVRYHKLKSQRGGASAVRV